MSETVLGGLFDGTYRAKWLRAVIASVHITDSTRVLLMTLAFHMDASGRVSVPREDLAALLGRNPRKVSEKVKAALESGFLIQVARGQKHQTAVYQAAIDGQTLSLLPVGHPDQILSVPPMGPAEISQGADFYDPEQNAQGTSNRHPEAQGADLRLPPGGPTEDSQVAPRGSSHMYVSIEAVEEVDLPDSDGLFPPIDASRDEAPAPKKRRKPETLIPADFAVTAELRTWAEGNGYTVDLDRETFRFRNHADSHERRCRDWTAAWRNWIDKAQDIADRDAKRSSAFSPKQPSPGSNPKNFTEEDYTSGW